MDSIFFRAHHNQRWTMRRSPGVPGLGVPFRPYPNHGVERISRCYSPHWHRKAISYTFEALTDKPRLEANDSRIAGVSRRSMVNPGSDCQSGRRSPKASTASKHTTRASQRGVCRNRPRLDRNREASAQIRLQCHVDSVNCPQIQRNPNAPNASAGQPPRRNSPGFTYSSA
jgi:hypothetical protein